MTNKIIEAARLAGMTLWEPLDGYFVLNGEHDAVHLERFYAIAYKQGLEDLAARFDQPHMEYFGTEIAEAAQELKEQQHG